MTGAKDSAPGAPLVIRSVEFLGGMASPSGWRPPPSLPEIAFSGRSNVGKSSLLNRLVRRKALARVSATPGKTREINFFSINNTFTLVDLPGYGYARVSKSMRSAWRPLIEGYLRSSDQLRGLVQLIDARRDASPDDITMLEFLSALGVPTIIAATKIDKLTRSAAAARLEALARQLGVGDAQIVPVSAVTGQGRDELAEAILELLEQPPWRSIADAPGPPGTR